LQGAAAAAPADNTRVAAASGAGAGAKASASAGGGSRGGTSAATAKRRKLSYKESTELTALPARIDALEGERSALYASLADPGFLRDGEAVIAAKRRLDALEGEIGVLTARWEELETVANP
jgi:ATP-binding cassette subfamily F protein uup